MDWPFVVFVLIIGAYYSWKRWLEHRTNTELIKAGKEPKKQDE